MDRTLRFDFIADSRFEQTKDDLVRWENALKNEIAKLPGVKIIQYGIIRHLTFLDSCEPKNSQWRKTYYIRKTRETTWDKIYETVNKVKVSRFRFT